MLIVIAGILYITNVWLIGFYIRKSVPGLLEIDAAIPAPRRGREYLWEKTVGTGIVPKWVSRIGIEAILFSLGSVVWLAIWLWPS